MTVPANKNSSSPTIVISDRDIENLLLEFGGNSKEAIRALLHDLAILAEDRDNSVSFGYVRGQLFNNKPDQQIQTKNIPDKSKQGLLWVSCARSVSASIEKIDC